MFPLHQLCYASTIASSMPPYKSLKRRTVDWNMQNVHLPLCLPTEWQQVHVFSHPGSSSWLFCHQLRWREREDLCPYRRCGRLQRHHSGTGAIQRDQPASPGCGWKVKPCIFERKVERWDVRLNKVNYCIESTIVHRSPQQDSPSLGLGSREGGLRPGVTSARRGACSERHQWKHAADICNVLWSCSLHQTPLRCQ